jgi:F-box protein 18 (helicase)
MDSSFFFPLPKSDGTSGGWFDMILLTQEQSQIVSCDSSTILISAFAGTGKTTTLREFAAARPKKRILLIVFNNDAARSIRQIMPPHVDVYTSHALAFRAIARNWRREKLNRSPSAFCIKDLGIASDYEQARHIRDAINAFCYSNSIDIEGWARGYYAAKRRDLSTIDEPAFFNGLLKLWNILIDPDSNVGLHDVYFKLWQISRPKLNYDVILVDESQDTNDALLDVISLQLHAQRTIVGDSHQAIYAFRGAKDIMQQINGQRLYLTESFRFGQEIARLATEFLSTFKQENKSLLGRARWQSQILMPGEKLPKEGKSAVICRTNAVVFTRAARAIARDLPSLNVNIPDSALDDIVDAYYIFSKQFDHVRNYLMRKFSSFDKMVNYAESSADRELMMRCKIVEQHQHDIPKIAKKIRKLRDPDAQLTITTAHRSKGLEWENVALDKDFVSVMRGDEPAVSSYSDDDEYVLSEDEANLYYVAMTRAKNTLVINDELYHFAVWRDEQRAR